MQDFLFEISVFALKGVHYESIMGEEVHPSGMIDYLGIGCLYQL